MIKNNIPFNNLFKSDETFDLLYPLSIQVLAQKHWTPISVAKKVANFLAEENNVRVLDIGSGVGKFCLTAANYKRDALFYGVEQRRTLIDEAEAAKEILSLNNVTFIHGNFTQLDFKKYDHFYFYNSFYENLVCTNKIDDSIDYSGELYNYYHRYLYNELQQKPPGTRLATFHTIEDDIPNTYQIVNSEMEDHLRFWVKII
jgi:SAM-dependent methyltransferase